MELIKLKFEDEGYASLTLNRQEKLNSVSKKMTEELFEALQLVKENKEIKFLTVTGAGERAFCTGGDLNELHADMNAEEAYEILHPMKKVLFELATLPVPTITLLNGQARGGGCELATACDFRYGIESASYGFVQANLGITPGWGGGELLHSRIDSGLAAHWLMEASMYSAEYSYQIGWLHKVVSLNELRSKKVFQSFLNKTPEQMRVFKKKHVTHVIPQDLSRQMDEEVRQCSLLWESDAHKEAVQRFMNKTKN
ncbi:enoyl-CoA hydratase/isomerase family protein [Halobacillus sp. BBL2006]|uniref:enoyl-CoA hydratase/isomerase family protein n=1 Tax=Halobacillus sp. BBL2006 TaxID=1543706 RepID=UPI000543C4A8|nr:enoyl-CoA hydratase/isomerase family protein [Halobacillus sp. BBL2006]KHE71808.1 enoyl-CoA hydratase [Halobacillus sp. BBL2006]